jgi:hypothetical protein
MRFTTITASGLMILALAAGSAWGAPSIPQASSPSGDESAVWVPKELTFVYKEFTTQYSCDGLQQRMRTLLLGLGARSDLQVRGYGCTRLVGPDPFAGVRIKLNVLQPANGQAEHTVLAHWQTVRLPPEHDPLLQAADCELIQQVGQQILPLFAARNVEVNSQCEARNVVPGSTRLTAQVLIADPTAPTAAAR